MDGSLIQVPVGIDVGSLNARIAYVSKSSVQIVSNAQGSRFTPALSTIEDEPSDGSPEILIGDAARKALQARKHKSIHLSSIRHLVRTASSNSDAKDSEGDEKKAEDDSPPTPDVEKAFMLSSSFFAHISQLVCDATSTHPSQLKFVLSVPATHVDETGELSLHCMGPNEIESLIQTLQTGVAKAIKATNQINPAASQKKKNRKKAVHKTSVVGVISEPAAVCMAHGLLDSTSLISEKSGTLTSDLVASTGFEKENSLACPIASSWSNCLVVSWGASGLTATVVKRILAFQDNVTPRHFLSVDSTHHSAACSGHAIVKLLMEHAASMFERKNRTSDVLSNYKARSKLESACETALKTLARTTTVHIAVDGFYDGLDLQLSLSRPRVEMLLGPLMRQAESFLIGSTAQDISIDAVLMSGGVCDLPIVNTLIQKLFPSAWRGDPSVSVDEAVTIGCARYASQIVKTQSDLRRVQQLDLDAEPIKDTVCQLLCPSVNLALCPVEISLLFKRKDAPDGDQDVIEPMIKQGFPLPISLAKSLESVDLYSSIQIIVSEAGKCSSVLAEVSLEHNDSPQLGLYLALTEEGKISISVDGTDTTEF